MVFDRSVFVPGRFSLPFWVPCSLHDYDVFKVISSFCQSMEFTKKTFTKQDLYQDLLRKIKQNQTHTITLPSCNSIKFKR